MMLGEIVVLDFMYLGFRQKMNIFKAVLLLSSITNVCGLDQTTMDIILNTHNNFRKNLANGLYGFTAANMRKMVWSVDLQLQAELSLNCALTLSSSSDPFDIYTNVGTSRERNITHILRTWILEKQHFIPQFETCIHIQQCKRFLTMAHAKHHAVGCAVTNRCQLRGAGVSMLVCKYGASNDPIVPAFKPGDPCTKCAGLSSFCDQGLCVPCTTSANNCECRKTCVKDRIGFGTLNNRTCTCRCTYGLGPNCDEDCVNPEMYEDWDICAAVTSDECQSSNLEERAILRELCPVQCSCRRHPDAITRQGSDAVMLGTN